jgi:branched-subunit amino acid ABC-type transport system permease component
MQVPTGYRDAISFGILIIILLIKPSGILGRKA